MEPLFSLSAWLAAPEVQAGITVFTFVATIVAFVMNKVRSDIVALCSMAALLLTGVISPKEALSGFSNSAVVIMIGLFVVGGAVFQTGLAKTISGRLLRLAQAADAPVIVVHLTCREGLGEIRRARARGQRVYAETCPQYLLMDDSLYKLPGMEGAKYVCAPPLRGKEDAACLWQALAAGEIQTISTDHCSFTTAQKALGREDFTKIPGGMPGVETRGVLIYTYGVDAGRIRLEDMCRLLAENPAKLYGMFPRKGILAPGSDADIVIMRTGVSDVITAAGQLQNVDYAPFEGWKTTARVEQVLLRGIPVVKNGKVVQERQGIYVARGRYSL